MEEKKSSLIKDIIEVVLGVAVTSFILINFVLMPVKVDGISMYPTLDNGNFGYSFIITKNLGIKRFDIVIIELEDGRLLVKRAIGLPGEKVEYKSSKLYINGEYIEEKFLMDSVKTCADINCNLDSSDDFEIELGEKEYFCLGDNREHSRDSRYYHAFHEDDIKATKIFILWPFNSLGLK